MTHQCKNPSCPVAVEKQKFYFHKGAGKYFGKCMECVKADRKTYYDKNTQIILAKARKRNWVNRGTGYVLSPGGSL